MKKLLTLLFLIFSISTGYAQTSSLIIPMRSISWQQHFNTANGVAFGLAAPLKPQPDGSLQEVLPITPNLRFNYLIHPMLGLDISKYSSITYTIGISPLSGNPNFPWLSPTNRCTVGCNPVSARLMIWGPPGGNLSNLTNRWWANPMAIPLAPGKFTLTVPLAPQNWSGVLGQSAINDLHFQAALKTPYALCITFGGGWYYGHGTYTSGGKAAFTLYNYQLN